MKLLLIALMFAGIAFADKAQAESAVASGVAQCRAQGASCTVTATYTEMGWLWKNGVPVNNTTVTVTAKVEAPKAPPPPVQTVIVYVSPFLFPPVVTR